MAFMTVFGLAIYVFFFNDFKNTQILFDSKEIIPAPTSQGWEGDTRCVWIYRLVMISSLTPNSNPLLRFIIFFSYKQILCEEY